MDLPRRIGSDLMQMGQRQLLSTTAWTFGNSITATSPSSGNHFRPQVEAAAHGILRDGRADRPFHAGENPSRDYRKKRGVMSMDP